MLATQNESAVQETLLERLNAARRSSDAIFDLVRTDAIYEQADSGASPDYFLSRPPGGI